MLRQQAPALDQWLALDSVVESLALGSVVELMALGQQRVATKDRMASKIETQVTFHPDSSAENSMTAD